MSLWKLIRRRKYGDQFTEENVAEARRTEIRKAQVRLTRANTQANVSYVIRRFKDGH